MDSILDVDVFLKVSIFIEHELSILHWDLVSVLVLILFIKRNIVFSNFNVKCVKKNKNQLIWKKKVKLLKKKLRQKHKALKKKRKEKKNRLYADELLKCKSMQWSRVLILPSRKSIVYKFESVKN